MRMTKDLFLMRTHLANVERKREMNPIELIVTAVKENKVQEVRSAVLKELISFSARRAIHDLSSLDDRLPR